MHQVKHRFVAWDVYTYLLGRCLLGRLVYTYRYVITVGMLKNFKIVRSSHFMLCLRAREVCMFQVIKVTMNLNMPRLPDNT
jgi:hypothetical protein